MLGAIIGDIVGSNFEFDNHKDKVFDLFTSSKFFTDDTVMTLAIGLAFKNSKKDFSDLHENAIKYMRMLGREYFKCSYGSTFRKWLRLKKPIPYNSYGNGAAMRVSPVLLYAKTLEDVIRLSRQITEVTHNSTEGIKGAESVAVAAFLAKTGKTKEEIKEYIIKNYYDIKFTLDEIRPTYKFDESCQGSVPEALECFFEGKDFEDTIRNAISIGGDSDTIAAIAGIVAEAFYGIPFNIATHALKYLDNELFKIYVDTSNLETKIPFKVIAGIKKDETWGLDDTYYFKIGNQFYPFMCQSLSIKYPIPNIASLLHTGNNVINIEKNEDIPAKIINCVEQTINDNYFEYLNNERNRYII